MSSRPTTKWTTADAAGPIAAASESATSLQAYTIVIFATVAVAASFLISPGWIGFFGAGLAIITVTIAVIDFRSFRIPDWLNISGFILALIAAAAQQPEAWATAIATACLRGGALALMFLALRYGYKFIRGREGLGLGDVKLAAMAGAWLDWFYIPITIELAAFAALTVCLLRYFVTGQPLSPTARLPLGTFLAPAIWISWALDQIMISLAKF